MKHFFSRLNLSSLLLLELIFVFFVLTFSFSIIFPLMEVPDLRYNGHEFSLMANSFLEGKLHIPKFGLRDCTMIDGRCYWPLGPFPAIALIPFVFLFNIFSLPFYQGYLSFFITIGVFLLAYKLAQKFRYSLTDSLWLALAFCFSSVYLGVALKFESYYVAHVFTVFLLFLAILEFFTKKRYFLIGVYFAFIFATRFSAGLGILFFILMIFFDKETSFKVKIKQFFLLSSPVFVNGLLLLYYNFIRFGNFFDNGYTTALVGGSAYGSWREQYGLFNLYYLVYNFYNYFLKMPELIFAKIPYLKASWTGLSFFIVSPIFIKIFWAKLKDKIIVFSWISSLIVLFLVLIYYHNGAWQFGPRYTLDFLPFWFLILLYSFREFKLKSGHRLVIGLSSLLNLLIFLSLHFWPLLFF